MIGGDQLPRLIWLLMALLLVGMGVARVARRRPTDSRAPGVLSSLLIWGGLIALVVLLYNGAAFWVAIGSLVRRD